MGVPEQPDVVPDGTVIEAVTGLTDTVTGAENPGQLNVLVTRTL